MTKRIEEEIQSHKFRNEFHKAGLNILVTAHWLSSQNSDVFKKYGLTPQQYNVLRILRGRFPSPCTLLSVRERMIDKMSDVSRIIERMRVAGYVERTSCSGDRRAVDLKITDKGLDLLKDMEKEEPGMDALLHGLSENEARTLNDLLDKIRS